MSQKGAAYAPAGVTKKKAAAFLQDWEDSGGAYEGIRPFCRAKGWNYEWVRFLRSKWPAFLQGMEAAKARWISDVKLAAKPFAEAQAAEAADDRYRHLRPPWKREWLEKYRTAVDRRQACELVGKTLAEVEAAMGKDNAFALAYDEVEREHLAGLEDSMKRNGLAGKSEAQRAVLAAKMPGVYGTKVKVDHNVSGTVTFGALQASAAARPQWHELYGRHQAALPASTGDAEVIEAELVEAT